MKHLQQARAMPGLSATCISGRYLFGAGSCQAACCGSAGSGGDTHLCSTRLAGAHCHLQLRKGTMPAWR